MSNYYYITSPIYYVNDVPHIGHAYTTLACDVIARYMRLSGKNVKFVTGTDEHGQKVEKTANQANMDPQAFTDKVSLRFKDLAHALNIQYDDFIRTTEIRHKIAVEHLWNKLVENNAIYLGKYAGWYSVRDEAFYAETELTADGLAPTGAPVEWVEEPSYFFALSKWQDKLLEFYEANPNFIRPESRRNEIVNFVKNGLEDLSVSRTSFAWGIKVPNHPEHVIYVWLDALTNYISALGYPDIKGDFAKYWPADLHIVGKDITRFHAIYWPAFLMAADLTPPKSIMAHGWWTNEGQKISKSLGNVIDPFALINEFGIDQVRYFLMREVIFGNDGNYSRDSMINRINAELANKIGNLVQRTIAFVNKIDNKIPPKNEDWDQSELIVFAQSLHSKFDHAMNVQNINFVLNGIIELAEKANIYIDNMAPWNLKKTDINQMNHVLYILLETIKYIAIYLQPFTPMAANKIMDLLNLDLDIRDFKAFKIPLKTGSEIRQAEVVFPKFE